MIDNNNQKPNASFDIDSIPKPYEGMGCAIAMAIVVCIGFICGLTWIGFVIYGWCK